MMKGFVVSIIRGQPSSVQYVSLIIHTFLGILTKSFSLLFRVVNKLSYYLGCPIQALWKHLEERRPPFSLKLDDGAKQFLWEAIARTPDIEFFALAEPFPHIVSANQGERTDNESAHFQAQTPLDQVLVFKLNATCWCPIEFEPTEFAPLD